MKALFLGSAFTLLLTARPHAQTSPTFIKNDISTLSSEEKQMKEEEKTEKQTEKAIKKEMKEDKKALRNINGRQVSYQAKQAFYADFGDLPSAHWRSTNEFDEATFVKDGKEMTAYYDDEANLVGTTMQKSFSDLPANTQRYIHEKYSGYGIGDVIFFDDNEENETDMILYGTPFEDEDNYFVPLTNGHHTLILRVSMTGNSSFFKELK